MVGGEHACTLPANDGDDVTRSSFASSSGDVGSQKPMVDELDESTARTERIVLADDDPFVRKSTLMILKGLGYQVDAYASGIEALVALSKDERPVKLLLTDFDMPGLTGYELARCLRALWPDARVLLTSGSAEEHIAPAAKPDDWPPFIPKPFTRHTLCRKLREVLDEQSPSSER